MRKQMIALALLALLPFAASAQEQEEDDSGFSWNAAVTSDYVFRGVSQNSEVPAIQGGIDYSWTNGFYVGAWASQVDFDVPGTPNTEVDTYVGYSWDVSDAVNLDFQLVRYNYLDYGSEYGNPAYNELIVKGTFVEDFSATLAYTNDVYASGTNSLYYGVGYDHAFSNGVGIHANAGRTQFDTDEIGLEDYTDWGAHVSFPLGVLEGSFGYVGNDGNGRDNFGELADSRFVLTVSYEH